MTSFDSDGDAEISQFSEWREVIALEHIILAPPRHQFECNSSINNKVNPGGDVTHIKY